MSSNQRMCVRCRKAEVFGDLFWCPSCRSYLSMESEYLHSLEVARGCDGEDRSEETALEQVIGHELAMEQSAEEEIGDGKVTR